MTADHPADAGMYDPAESRTEQFTMQFESDPKPANRRGLIALQFSTPPDWPEEAHDELVRLMEWAFGQRSDIERIRLGRGLWVGSGLGPGNAELEGLFMQSWVSGSQDLDSQKGEEILMKWRLEYPVRPPVKNFTNKWFWRMDTAARTIFQDSGATQTITIDGFPITVATHTEFYYGEVIDSQRRKGKPVFLDPSGSGAVGIAYDAGQPSGPVIGFVNSGGHIYQQELISFQDSGKPLMLPDPDGSSFPTDPICNAETCTEHAGHRHPFPEEEQVRPVAMLLKDGTVKATDPETQSQLEQLQDWRRVALSKWRHYRDTVWVSQDPRHDVARNMHAHNLAKLIPHLMGLPAEALNDELEEPLDSYGEGTLFTVRAALMQWGMTETEALNAITTMQNNGILFRERS